MLSLYLINVVIYVYINVGVELDMYLFRMD